MNIPDSLVEAISNTSVYRFLEPSLSDEELVLKELEHAYTKADPLTGLATAKDLHSDIFDFVSRNNELLEKRTFLCVNIKDLMSFGDRYGLAAGDRLIAAVASYLSNEYPNSDPYRVRGEKFVITLRDPFDGLQQGFERELHYAIAETALRRKNAKHWRIVDGILLTIHQALFESCKEGKTINYEVIAS